MLDNSWIIDIHHRLKITIYVETYYELRKSTDKPQRLGSQADQ